MVLKVPVGTVIYAIDESEMRRSDLLADLTHPGERVMVAQGGVGGKGNIHFVTPTRRAPAFAELGEPALEHWIELEVKLMADAALVGMPSVGKSSLISHMSKARPKIADYPFTTLEPNLGMVKVGEYQYVVADIPGLIEGASEGKGLGHEFLRHVERTAMILHVLDLSGSFEGRDPLEDFKIINNELKNYAPELLERPMIIVGNKADLDISKENDERVSKMAQEAGYKYFSVSAVSGQGMQAFMMELGAQIQAIKEEQAVEETHDFDHVWEVKRQKRDKAFTITDLGGGVWRVEGKAIERMVIQTDWENEEAVGYLQHRFKKAGLDEALVKAGAKNGDEIRILEIAFEHQGGIDPFEDMDDEELFELLDSDNE